MSLSPLTATGRSTARSPRFSGGHTLAGILRVLAPIAPSTSIF